METKLRCEAMESYRKVGGKIVTRNSRATEEIALSIQRSFTTRNAYRLVAISQGCAQTLMRVACEFSTGDAWMASLSIKFSFTRIALSQGALSKFAHFRLVPNFKIGYAEDYHDIFPFMSHSAYSPNIKPIIFGAESLNLHNENDLIVGDLCLKVFDFESGITGQSGLIVNLDYRDLLSNQSCHLLDIGSNSINVCAPPQLVASIS